MTEQERDKVLAKLDEECTKMRVALLGYDGEQGQPGLCKLFDRLTKDYLKFKVFCCIIFGILIGTGVVNAVTGRMWFW